jgi:hypothetical protein
MKEEKLVKLQVNYKSNQCRLSVPQCHWNNISKSGWYKVTENNGVLTYTPADKPIKAKIPSFKDTDRSNKATTKATAEKKDEFISTINSKQNLSNPLDYANLSVVPEHQLFDDGDVWNEEDEVPT